jgi:hypothetical protein
MVVGQGARYYAEQSWLGVFSVSQIQVNALHPQEFGHVALYVSPCLERERERSCPALSLLSYLLRKRAQFR